MDDVDLITMYSVQNYYLFESCINNTDCHTKIHEAVCSCRITADVTAKQSDFLHTLQSVDKERTLVAHIQQLLLRIPRPDSLLAFFVKHLPSSFVLTVTCPA